MSPSVAFGQTGENASWREKCRTRVSGEWLSRENRFQYAEGLVQKVQADIAVLKKTSDALKSQHDGLKKKIAAEREFSPGLHSQLKIILQRYKGSLYQYEQHVEHLPQYEKELARATESRKNWHTRMDGLFVKVPVNGKHKSKNTFAKIDFVESCPKYRFACALAVKTAVRLRKRFADLGSDYPCVRYSGMSGIK